MKGITAIPILLHSNQGKHQLVFLDECLHYQSETALLFTDSEFTHTVNSMPDADGRHFKALIQLVSTPVAHKGEGMGKVLRSRHQAEARRLVEVFASIVPQDEDLEQLVVKKVGKDWTRKLQERAADHENRKIAGLLSLDWRHIFSIEMSHALKDAHLILWWSGKRLQPAIFCKDCTTAAYATALFGRRWKVCPYSACGKWFSPTSAKQEYCCPKHREAYRVARWRQRRRRKSKRQQT